MAGNDLQQLLIRLWHVSTIVPGCCERSLEGIATCHIPGKRAGSLHDYRPPRPTFLHVSAYLQKYTVDNLHVHRVYMQTPAHIHAYLHTCIHDYMHIYIYQSICMLTSRYIEYHRIICLTLPRPTTFSLNRRLWNFLCNWAFMTCREVSMARLRTLAVHENSADWDVHVDI